jgi:hypothetical protein
MAPVGPAVPAVPDARLTAEAIAGWRAYVAAVDGDRDDRDRRGVAFVAGELRPDAAGWRDRLRTGEVIIEQVDPPRTGDGDVEVPSADVHHWRGTIFIPGISAHGLVDAIERDGPDTRQDDVLDARILERRPGWQRVFLRVRRSKVVTVIYNTEHVVRFARPAPDRAGSTTTATRIAEIEHAGTPEERERTPGHDRGFLWRWNASWRYLDTPGGVLVECESLSLSRETPMLVRYLVAPMVRSTAREAMGTTLEALRARYAAPSRP